jgi:hypothetical protein
MGFFWLCLFVCFFFLFFSLRRLRVVRRIASGLARKRSVTRSVRARRSEWRASARLARKWS